MKHRLAMLISGGGTTMEAIIKACQTKELNINVACIISSRPDAGGIVKAKKLGIPDKDILVINPKGNVTDFGLSILTELKKRHVTVVTQNGWLPLTPEIVIEAYPDTMFNQHPGPVPEFGGQGMYGKRVHAARLLFARTVKRDMWTEAICQRVHKFFDQGEVIKAARIPILPDDTVDDLYQRLLPIEHQVQIEALKDFVAGKIRIERSRESLVKPDEEQILLNAKHSAKLLYPKG